jgi:hypothetical protein
VILLLGCGSPSVEPPGEAPPPPAPVVERAPDVSFRLPEVHSRSPAPIGLTPELRQARTILEKVVVDHARDPGNAWAVVHGMLALGPDMQLTDGTRAVDGLLSRYGRTVDVGGTPLVGFPTHVGESLVEPHTDLILKALTESGFSPQQPVTVEGRPATLGDVYRHSLWKAWATPQETGFQEGKFNDTPWSLQALSAWAPEQLTWTAKGGRAMQLDTFTDLVVDKLVAENAELDAARDAGAPGASVQKDTRRGIFRYTCGGQHLLQGAAYAVGRGFGRPENRATICDQLSLLRWRVDVELGSIDPHLANPQTPQPLKLILLTQRLKFLGHWLETTHKVGALGVCPLTAEDVAASERVAAELARSVDALGLLGIWADVGAVRADRSLDAVGRPANQVYLDLVGDSAHAVRGIDLASGVGTLAH